MSWACWRIQPSNVFVDLSPLGEEGGGRGGRRERISARPDMRVYVCVFVCSSLVFDGCARASSSAFFRVSVCARMHMHVRACLVMCVLSRVGHVLSRHAQSVARRYRHTQTRDAGV